MIPKHIHRRLIKRLIAVWAVLTVLGGFIAYSIEHDRIDETVKKLALEEANFLVEDYVDYINSDNPEHSEALLKKTHQHIEKGHFIIIDIYNRNKKKIVEGSCAQGEEVKKEIHLDPLKEKLSQSIEHTFFYINKNIYVQIITPLFSDSNDINGYLEGVYQLDKQTLSTLKKHIITSLGMILAVILMSTLVLYPVIVSFHKSLVRFSLDLTKANIGMLETLGGAIAKRDSDTSEHNNRVTIYSIHIGREIGLNDDQMRGLIKGAFLHDVGKIGISDNILLKPDKLTHEEFEIMKTHVLHGLDIVNKYKWLQDAADVVLYHHEKFDGSGYMSGLSGKNIPINARIFAIADVFDALTSKRPYKEPFSFGESMQILRDGAGTHFDSRLMDVFNKIAFDLYQQMFVSDTECIKDILTQLVNKYFLSDK